MGKKNRAPRPGSISKIESPTDKLDYAHVYIATPAYDGKVDCDFASSLANSAIACAVFGIRMTAATMGNSCFIDLARNMFVRIFLEEHKDCTHLFFIDSDLKFEQRAVPELVRHCTPDRPVVAGAYRRRNKDLEDYPIVWSPHPEIKGEDGQDTLWLDDDDWLMADRVATGFLCIRREILQEMSDEADRIHVQNQAPIPRLFYTQIDEESRFVGEDFSWCSDYCAKYDTKISVWTDFDFEHGGLACNYSKWLRKEVEKFKWNRENVTTKLGDRREGAK